MTDNYIEHEVKVHEVTEDYESWDTEVYYAVRAPSIKGEWRRKLPNGEWGEITDDFDTNGPWFIKGGQEVCIYNKTDIEGLRGLLDKIEATLVK